MGKAVKQIALIAVAVFAPYAAAALGLSGFAATAFSFVLQAAAGAILGPDKPKGPSGADVQDSGMLITKQGNVQQIPVVYGERRVGGTRVYIESTDASGATSGTEYLHIVMALAQGGTRSDGTDSISAIDTIYFNDRTAWSASGGIDGYFSGLLTVRGWLGKNDQTVASPDISAGTFPVSADWTSNHRMRGVAYIYVICRYDRDKFPGAPTITVDIKGKRIQAVNNLGTFVNTPAEMNNPANILYDYLTNSRFGKGLDATELDLTSFQDARTWATSAGVELNGGLITSETIFNNTQRLLGCSNMNLVFVNGKYSVQPIKQESFTGAFTFNTSNILGKWTIGLGKKQTRFNQMKVNYFNPSLDWQPDSLLIENATYLTEDSNIVNEKTIDLPLIGDKTLAQKIGTYYLNLSRYQTIVQFNASHEALKLQVGDPVYITHEVPGWTNEKFRVNSITLLPDSTVDVVLESYAPDSIYLENN